MSTIPYCSTGGVPNDTSITYSPRAELTVDSTSLRDTDDDGINRLIREIERRIEFLRRSYLLREGLCKGDKGESRWIRLRVIPCFCTRAPFVVQVKITRVNVTSVERSRELKLKDARIIAMV